MRRRFTQQQWLDWIEEQSRSGLSVTEFCRQKNVGQKSFYLWRKKLAELSEPRVGADVGIANVPNAAQAGSSGKRARSSGSNSSSSCSLASFVSLSMVGAPSVEIDLPCGATMRVPHDEGVMRCVLGVLLEVGRGA